MLNEAICGTVRGRTFKRVLVGSACYRIQFGIAACDGCGRANGELHERWCHCEPCPRCRGQLVTCGCFRDWMWPEMDLICVH